MSSHPCSKLGTLGPEVAGPLAQDCGHCVTPPSTPLPPLPAALASDSSSLSLQARLQVHYPGSECVCAVTFTPARRRAGGREQDRVPAA